MQRPIDRTPALGGGRPLPDWLAVALVLIAAFLGWELARSPGAAGGVAVDPPAALPGGETAPVLAAPDGAAGAAPGRTAVPVTEDFLARGRAFNRRTRDPGGYPTGIRDPDTYNPLDRELRDQMLRELEPLELIEKALVADAQTHLAAREALDTIRPRCAAALRGALASGDEQGARRRGLALEGVRLFSSHEFREELAILARADPLPGLRARALGLLAGADRGATLAGLNDPDWTVRNAAVAALDRSQSPDDELRTAVRGLHADAHPLVKKRAGQLLEGWGG